MPTQPFTDLFQAWPGNLFLTMENLRLKCITLLALAMMLRPSDIAPRATVFDEDQQTFQRLILTTENVQFNTDNSVTITFFGIKNDYSRDGFAVVIQPALIVKLDPVATLRCYIKCSRYQRPKGNPLFLALNVPYGVISASTMSRILDKAISITGLRGQGFSAKSFRPTGAMIAVESDINADAIQKISRWKSQSTFEDHYVHAKPPKQFTDSVLKIKL